MHAISMALSKSSLGYMFVIVILTSLLLGLVGGSSAVSEPVSAVSTVTHDHNCFTQGLVLQGDVLYESCGLYGKSSLRIVNAKTGEIIRKTKVGKRYFAEGIVVHDKKVYMLTWKSKTLLVYDAENLELLRGLSFESSNGEGWGFTSDGTHFIASDGSSTLTYFLPPAEGDKSLTVAKRVQVVDPESGKPVTQINELQFVEGYIYANIWYRDIIVQIDAATGEVVRKFDMSALYPHRQRAPGADCLNGIAFNSQDGTFLVTGKKWPLYYTVRLAAADALDSEHNGDKLHRSGGRGGGGGGAGGAASERGLSVDDNVSLDL